MARGAAHVPKFGDWGNEQSVPYTMCFDKAREVKTSTGAAKIINPNDPQENPDLFPPRPDHQEPRPRVASKFAEPKNFNNHRDAQDNPLELFPSRPADQEPRPKTHNDHHRDDVDSNNVNKRNFEPPPRNVDNRRPTGQQFIPSNAGSEHKSSHVHQGGVKWSHPTGRGNAVNPAGWNSLDQDTNNNASTKSRMGQGSRKQVDNNNRYHQQRTGSPAVPKFGDWETKDLSSGENFTQIFNKVREDKKNPTPDRLLNIAQKQPEAGYGNPSTQAYNKNDKQKMCGCFGR